ncbi:MAG: division/cell wall cluster transcriptional repressor MraZ [Bdellovibrionales bacterium]|nr:division/cell wall cluster transcriptional repressor MraZ [Bdellovibrionales bacterium]
MEQELRGRFQIKLDGKGRLGLPSALHQGSENSSFVITNSQYQGSRCLDVYRADEWEALEARIAQMSSLKREVQAFQRFYIAGGQAVNGDSQGRLLIPKSLREYAGLEDQIVLVGMGKKLEIWNLTEWQKIFDNLATQFEDTLNVIASLDMGAGHA